MNTISISSKRVVRLMNGSVREAGELKDIYDSKASAIAAKDNDTKSADENYSSGILYNESNSYQEQLSGNREQAAENSRAEFRMPAKMQLMQLNSLLMRNHIRNSPCFRA